MSTSMSCERCSAGPGEWCEKNCDCENCLRLKKKQKREEDE